MSTDKKKLAQQSHKMTSERRQLFCKYCNLHAVVMSDCSLIAPRKSHAKHKRSVGRIPELRQGRVAHQRHDMSSERSQKSYKYCNLHAVVMSDCSLTATRNSHAKINQWIAYLSTDKQELHDKATKWKVRWGYFFANIGTYMLLSCRIVRW